MCVCKSSSVSDRKGGCTVGQFEVLALSARHEIISGTAPLGSPTEQAGRQAGRLAGWQAGWQAGRLAGRLAGWLAGWLAGRQAGRLSLRTSSLGGPPRV